jgi:hypothetical protein
MKLAVMIRTLVISLVCVVLSMDSALAKSNDVFRTRTGAELVEICRAPPPSRRSRTCFDFVEKIAYDENGVRQAPFCNVEKMTDIDIWAGIQQYAKSRPNTLRHKVRAWVLEMLEATYPCRI